MWKIEQTLNMALNNIQKNVRLHVNYHLYYLQRICFTIKYFIQLIFRSDLSP